MDAAPAQTNATPAPRRGKLAVIVVCLFAVTAGAATPMVVNVPALLGKAPTAEQEKDKKPTKKKPKHGYEEKLVTIPFGEVVVNLSEERMTRYLRIKLVVQVEEEAEAKATPLVEKNKAALKTWIIGHVAGKTLKDVSGTVGVNRLQREIFERFEDTLYPGGDGPLRSVLFEEYVVQ
jgi:flagellar protein FliL